MPGWFTSITKIYRAMANTVQNCRKSSRICKRGVRLNFIDTQVKSIPTVPITHEWRGEITKTCLVVSLLILFFAIVQFQDESREIASDYAGGVARYAAISPKTPPKPRTSPAGSTSSSLSVSSAPPATLPALPPISLISIDTSPPLTASSTYSEPLMSSKIHRTSEGFTPATIPPPPPPSSLSSHTLSPPPIKKETRSHLDGQEETLFMQVFVEEVGLWMDSLDPAKHVSLYPLARPVALCLHIFQFSRLLPFASLQEPMLLNAFLACGARHLTLVNPAYGEDKALNYYDTATRLLLNSLQSQNRDMEICATTAVILNVYEIMSERARQRMNHIAGARALIKECGWSARSTGIGGACFWLNVSMELLSCLHFNWAVAWDPEDWGVDMDFTPTEPGREELWAYRIIYILAKIANFKANTSSKPLSGDQAYVYNETAKRQAEWDKLYELCLSWNDAVPRSMHPMAYLYPYQTTHKSAFPEVW